MVELIENLLSEIECIFLQNRCDNFVVSFLPDLNNRNHYVTSAIDTNEYLINYEKKVINFLFDKYKLKCFVNGSWINKVSNETNKSDDYHMDESDFTIITYLNDDFVGGEFVYLNDKNETIAIKPKKNLSILQNNRLRHKVNPVTAGVRFSLVTFIDYMAKSKKTLL